MKRFAILAVALAALSAPAFADSMGDTLTVTTGKPIASVQSPAAAALFAATQYSDGQTLGLEATPVDTTLVSRNSPASVQPDNRVTSEQGDTLGGAY